MRLRIEGVCGKSTYRTESEAKGHLRRVQRRISKVKMHVYFCRACRGFHVGH